MSDALTNAEPIINICCANNNIILIAAFGRIVHRNFVLFIIRACQAWVLFARFTLALNNAKNAGASIASTGNYLLDETHSIVLHI